MPEETNSPALFDFITNAKSSTMSQGDELPVERMRHPGRLYGFDAQGRMIVRSAETHQPPAQYGSREATPYPRMPTPIPTTVPYPNTRASTPLRHSHARLVHPARDTPLPPESKQLLEHSILDTLQIVSSSPAVPTIASSLSSLAEDLDVFNKAVDLYLKDLNLAQLQQSMASTSIKRLARFRHEARNRGTVDSLSVPISPDEVPVPQPVHRTFRSSSGTGETVWYPSSGPSDIQSPPQIPSTTGYLWVHRNTQTNRITMWMYGKDRVWEPAAPGKVHPFVEDRILKLRQNSGEPSWVTRSSDQTVRGREVKDKKKGVSLPPS